MTDAATSHFPAGAISLPAVAPLNDARATGVATRISFLTASYRVSRNRASANQTRIAIIEYHFRGCHDLARLMKASNEVRTSVGGKVTMLIFVTVLIGAGFWKSAASRW